MEIKKSILLKTEIRAKILLHYNYKKLFYKDYEIQIIENLMCNEACHYVAVFKDYLISDDNSEYLHRAYNLIESIQRLKKLFSYYEETSVIFPNYTPIVESKYLYDNVIKKQKVIDEQQNLEEYRNYLINKEKKKKLDNTLKKIENFFEQETGQEEFSKVFDSKAYDEILNANESVKRIVFGIENNKNEKKDDIINENDSVKGLLMNIDKYDEIRKINKKNKKNEFINDIKNKLEFTMNLLPKNKKMKKNNKSKPKNKNTILNKADNKDHSISFKKNRTININININNTKNNIAMTDRPYIANNNPNNLINNYFPLSTKGTIKGNTFNYNNNKINSAFPFQLFRTSHIFSNLKKKQNNTNNNNGNNNSINGLQQKLLKILNKKIKKNKNNERNYSFNFNLGTTSYTSRLREKNKAFIINSIQKLILHSKIKRNYSINRNSEKNIYSINKKKEKNNSNPKTFKKSCENINFYQGNKIKKNLNINIDNISIDKDNSSYITNNMKRYYSKNNKPLLTTSPSLKKRNIFGFKEIWKLTQPIYDYNFKNKNNRNTINNYYNHNNQNKSLKNKTYMKNANNKIINNIFSYKTNKNKKIYSTIKNTYKFQNI